MMNFLKKNNGDQQEQSVEFHCEEHLIDVLDHPVPAVKKLPEFYKKLPEQVDESPQSSTAKRCIPFLEAASAGFVIPMWAEMFVRVDDENLQLEFPENFPLDESIGYHGYPQLQNYPLADKLPHGQTLMKFINPWIIKTPPGVSCLFTSPLNRFEDRFKIIDGIVDTDTYYNNINFPFVWTGSPGEYTVKKGTPLVQVIPFVRSKALTRMSVGALSEPKRRTVNQKMGTVLKNKYRQFYWHKRKEK